MQYNRDVAPLHHQHHHRIYTVCLQHHHISFISLHCHNREWVNYIPAYITSLLTVWTFIDPTYSFSEYH